MAEPNLDDLSCALTAGVARRVVQDLNDNKPAHLATNPDGTCSDLECPCQEWARKEVEQLLPGECSVLECLCHKWLRKRDDVGTAMVRLEIIDSLHSQRAEMETAPRPQLWADAATVRAAILDALDDGMWKFHEAQFANNETAEDEANRARSNFAAAVLWRIRELQQLHGYPRLEVLCDKHKRQRLPTFSGECSDCAKERQ